MQCLGPTCRNHWFGRYRCAPVLQHALPPFAMPAPTCLLGSGSIVILIALIGPDKADLLYSDPGVGQAVSVHEGEPQSLLVRNDKRRPADLLLTNTQ